jgi:hypothetical protein
VSLHARSYRIEHWLFSKRKKAIMKIYRAADKVTQATSEDIDRTIAVLSKGCGIEWPNLARAQNGDDRGSLGDLFAITPGLISGRESSQ